MNVNWKLVDFEAQQLPRNAGNDFQVCNNLYIITH